MSLKKNLILFFIINLFLITKVWGLEIVYPKTNYEQINAPSTFFLGNTDANAKLEINGVPIKVYDNGSFTHVVNLKEGENRFFIKSTFNNKSDEQVYIVNRPPQQNNNNENVLEEFPKDEYIYALVMKENSPLRDKPNDDAKRLTHLDEETVLLLNGKQNDYYRVYLNSSEVAWIKTSLVVNYTKIKQNTLGKIYDIKTAEDKNFKYLKIALNLPLPYKIIETNKGLALELYGIKNEFLEKENLPTYNEMSIVSFNQQIADNTLSMQIEPFLDRLWGYDAYYDKNTLIIKIRKTPQLDNPSSITITIDAGHGGDEHGAIGLDGLKEKDINLDIAQKLEKYLSEVGFKTIMTRNNDSAVDLYQRVKVAKDSESLFLISLHANALPDGSDLSRKGTSTFYYNKESKKFAETLQKELLDNLKTNNDGVNFASFAVTRPTLPICALIEVAYMIIPEDYELLTNEQFRQKTAESIKDGIIKYLINNK